MDEQMNKHGAVSWVELLTTDVSGAKKFYEKLFGWTLEEMSVQGMNYTVIKVDGKEVGGMMKMPPGMPPGVPPYWGMYVTVDDIDAAVKTVQLNGGNIIVPPQEIPDIGRFAVIQDPQGSVVSIVTYK